jgi:ribosomal protein S18 acetylase RimI-like enzyme
MDAHPAAVRIEEADALSGELVAAIAELVGQLSASASAPSAEALEEIVASPASRLLLAREPGGRIVGMLTLVVFRIPTGMRAWIEDVVVVEDARGRGVGERLTEAALELAETHGARTVDLTSRSGREAANRLYARLGFELRDTNVYRYAHRPRAERAASPAPRVSGPGGCGPPPARTAR